MNTNAFQDLIVEVMYQGFNVINDATNEPHEEVLGWVKEAAAKRSTQFAELLKPAGLSSADELKLRGLVDVVDARARQYTDARNHFRASQAPGHFGELLVDAKQALITYVLVTLRK